MFGWLTSKLKCKKCGREKAYKIVDDKAEEDLDMTGYHRSFTTKWKCKFCGHIDIEEGEEHER